MHAGSSWPVVKAGFLSGLSSETSQQNISDREEFTCTKPYKTRRETSFFSFGIQGTCFFDSQIMKFVSLLGLCLIAGCAATSISISELHALCLQQAGSSFFEVAPAPSVGFTFLPTEDNSTEGVVVVKSTVGKLCT
jgi:hypothetical protein